MDPILNPTVFIGSFEWREPVTTLTDFLVAFVAAFAFYKLQTYQGPKKANFHLYKYYFLCFAIGMTSAAWLGHGLQAYVSPRMKIIGWGMSATGLLFFALASLQEIAPLINKLLERSLRIWFGIQYVIFIGLILHPAYSDFILPQLNSTIFLIFLILPMHFFNYWNTRSTGSWWIMMAIGYGIIPGLAYNTQLTFSRWFNYHDLSHVLMAGFMFLMYLGVKKISREGVERVPEYQPMNA